MREKVDSRFLKFPAVRPSEAAIKRPQSGPLYTSGGRSWSLLGAVAGENGGRVNGERRASESVE